MCGRQNHNALAVDISKINGSLKRVHTKIGNKVRVWKTASLVKMVSGQRPSNIAQKLDTPFNKK